MDKKQIKYLLNRTFHESVISFFNLIDLVLPDLTILSPLRKTIVNIFWKADKRTRIRKGFRATRLSNIKIGSNCFINKNNFFDNGSEIIIGDDCSIGFDNKFLTMSHIEKDKIRPENKNTFFSKSINIGNNVWITSNCIILPGTKIGNNAIIGAGSVVKGKLDGNWIYEGNPIKKIRKTNGIMVKIR